MIHRLSPAPQSFIRRFRGLSQVLAGVCVLTLALCAVPVKGQGMDQAKPGAADPHAGVDMSQVSDQAANEAAITAFYAAQKRTAFQQNIQLDAFRMLAVQHRDQVKIIDSWARQSVYAIRHRASFGGMDSVYIALDIALRPEAWLDKNIVYVESVPIRDELGTLAASPAERERIHNEALISPNFFRRADVQQHLQNLAARDTRQSEAIGKVFMAYDAFDKLSRTLLILPPTADRRNTPWVHPAAVDAAEEMRKTLTPPQALPPALADLPPYSPQQVVRIRAALQELAAGWQNNDVTMANTGLAEFASLAPTIDSAGYPSETKRTVELWYNRTYSGTLVAFVYFAAMVLLLLVALGAVEKKGRTWRAGLWFFAAAFALHLTAMGVRWWLNGRIPIQNQFESVMGSACLGCLLGLLLETRWFGKAVGWVLLPIGLGAVSAALTYWYTPLGVAGACVPAAIVAGLLYAAQVRFRISRAIEEKLAPMPTGIFGTAFAFVGFLATTLMLAAPYVFPNDLGASGGRVAGILMTGWLYIHVNIVIASYALIMASAVIALIFLGLRQWHWVNPIEPGFEEEGGAEDGDDAPRKPRGRAAQTAGAPVLAVQQAAQANHQRQLVLDALDQANMIILQMAFWMLGVGILCGAVWADQSWGRPWGWDPKETFALVTWIVYLIIVHIRLVVKFKSDTTALLALAGCGVMLFNYIGVNYFLAGLHSYA